MGLNSASVIKIVDLLCEGPIEGVEDARKGVYLDESPLQAQSGEDLVDKDLVTFDSNKGGREPSYLPQLKGGELNTVIDVSKEIGTGYTEILNDDGTEVRERNYGSGQQTVQITDPDTDSIDLIFTIPRLFSSAQEGLVKGQLFDARVFFDVFIQSVGSGTSFKRIKVADVDEVSEAFRNNGGPEVFYIEGISTTAYQFKISGIELEGKAPWNVKVTKYPQAKYQGDISHTRSDAADVDQDIFRATYQEFEDLSKTTPLKSGRANTLFWTSVVATIKDRTANSFCATVGMDISTEEFQSLPTRAYLVKGKKVLVPSNAVPREDGSLEFIGSFDGSLGEAVWTTCPVCIFYDLMTNKRFGAGNFVEASNLSWVDLYPLAQYSNQLIDGEPRFACNVAVSSQVEAFTIFQDFASVFRGMMYWQSNTIQLTADHGNLDSSIVDPVHIFSNSNVINGVFNYSGSSLKTRSTSIRIRYIDPDNFYKPNILVVEDAELITKYGYQVKDVLAFGCTSKNQARRLGRWMMKSEELDSNTVTFAVGLDGALVFPGQVFAIQDELRAAKRLSGRINYSTPTSIVADQSITLPAGANPMLTCILNDGTVESRSIASTSGTTITVESAFSSLPLEQAVYSISTTEVNEQKFRCLSVSDNADGTFAVVAVQFNDSIYGTADAGGELEFKDVTTVDKKPPMPVI
jgi:predicted phage tail protein